MSASGGRVSAVLGPTNTGKTLYAIERMLGHSSGMIGLPLRLLAREVFDKVRAMRGPSMVALVTGEERIVPPQAVYWVCTVEAMPTASTVDFLAVDEIQLCGDPDRGHIFTDRLLHARGRSETLFLGSDTMRNVISELVPDAAFQRRGRLSNLTYTGAKKISRMKARTAIVGFSVEDVYAIAELVRRQRGGAAIVMGALSPRTRNAQVEVFQNGDVDFLVATDAIGMGLNLDISHVAFSGLSKFDGREFRRLATNELAQIAGRAGRFLKNGTFGVTGDAPPLEPGVAAAIMENRFAPVRKLQWRNSDLEFGSIEALIDSICEASGNPLLAKAREADDLLALREIAPAPEVRSRLSGSRDVRLLWDVCQLPDFRKISAFEHSDLLKKVFTFIQDHGFIPDDWLDAQISRIDKTDGDVDALSRRIAFVRTWTYVAQRRDWVEDFGHWRERTREVEDRLSDALHAVLTRRFIDKRTSVLMGRLKRKEEFLADINERGEVSVDGQHIGRIEGFRFRQDKGATPGETETLKQAGRAALGPEFSLRAARMYKAPNSEFDFSPEGDLTWNGDAVGKLSAGHDVFSPKVAALVSDEAGEDVREKVERRLSAYVEQTVLATCGPLLALRSDEELAGLGRGFAYRLVEAMGVLRRAEVADEVKALDQDARRPLRKHGVRFGQYCVFVPAVLKPAATRMRVVLQSLTSGAAPNALASGLVTIPVEKDVPAESYLFNGYYPAGSRAIRADMLERLADMLREQDRHNGFEANADMLSITGLSLEQFASVMEALGYQAVRGERERPVRVESGESGDAPNASAGLASARVADDPPSDARGDSAAEGRDASASEGEDDRADADAKTDAGIEAEADKKADAEESPRAEESVIAAETADAGERPGAEGGADAEEPPNAEESVDVAEKADASEKIAAAEKADVAKSPRAEESVAAAENADAGESQSAEASVDAEERSNADESVDAAEQADASEKGAADEKADAAESPSAEESIAADSAEGADEAASPEESAEHAAGPDPDSRKEAKPDKILYYTFSVRPRRRPRDAGGERDRGRRTGSKSPDGKRDGGAPNAAGRQSKPDGQAKRPRRNQRGRKPSEGRPESRPKRAGKGVAAAAPPPRAKPARKVDPDSPFAVLEDLKGKL